MTLRVDAVDTGDSAPLLLQDKKTLLFIKTDTGTWPAGVNVTLKLSPSGAANSYCPQRKDDGTIITHSGPVALECPGPCAAVIETDGDPGVSGLHLEKSTVE